MNLAAIRPQRQIKGISAVLLPFQSDGEIDWHSYENGLERTWECGLTPAVNMDTGYANLLSPDKRHEILNFVASRAQNREFIAGAYVQDLDGDVIRSYLKESTRIEIAGGLPILFQSTALTLLPPTQRMNAYEKVGREVKEFLAFELGKMFVSFGEIYDTAFFEDLIQIPTLTGLKHSSLSRELEWQRLEIRDRVRPDFRVYTGNDLAIDMVQWGSDYLLGLSAFYPEAFSIRDRYWATGDRRFYELNDWLQYLGFIAFRDPVPAYKHNCAMFLKERGIIQCDFVPPKGLARPESDRSLMVPILRKIDELIA